MEVTTWAKRRPSNVRAVTQVKRLSLVTHPEADRVENLEGNSRRPQWRWSLETPAGSKSTAWAETEAFRQLGDPPPSWSGCYRPSISTEWANPEEDKHDGGSRTRWEYSERGKAAYMGKRRGRLSCWSRETFPAHSEVGEECPQNWIRSQRRQSQTQRCASPRWRICSHRSFSKRPGSK